MDFLRLLQMEVDMMVAYRWDDSIDEREAVYRAMADCKELEMAYTKSKTSYIHGVVDA